MASKAERIAAEARRLLEDEAPTVDAAAVASLAVEVADDGEPEWLGVVAFAETAETLARHAKGDCVSVSGRLQRRTYTTRSGEERQQLQVVADSLVSARSVRPGKRRQQGQQQAPLEQARQLYG